jgi:hypothetical protein
MKYLLAKSATKADICGNTHKCILIHLGSISNETLRVGRVPYISCYTGRNLNMGFSRFSICGDAPLEGECIGGA